MRAVPQRTPEGAPPLVGMLPHAGPREGTASHWILAGLGVRGLVYHALMAELLVAAIRSGDDSGLPSTLKRWQREPS